MLWVTRSQVRIDRLACPWLITRFIDSEAEFLFVPASQVDSVSVDEGAIPFDAPGADLGRHGDMCTFDALIERYGLEEPALSLMAEIVRGAVTGTGVLHPASAGLAAIAEGFSLRYPDDYSSIDRQYELYDSLYAWCRLQTAPRIG
ncbi:chromate resistance protein [Candidatus Fermentibacteria bacterium]|nr:chromate resistance protein [Candidatus Fermentibacteria bacterium]